MQQTRAGYGAGQCPSLTRMLFVSIVAQLYAVPLNHVAEHSTAVIVPGRSTSAAGCSSRCNMAPFSFRTATATFFGRPGNDARNSATTSTSLSAGFSYDTANTSASQRGASTISCPRTKASSASRQTVAANTSPNPVPREPVYLSSAVRGREEVDTPSNVPRLLDHTRNPVLQAPHPLYVKTTRRRPGM